MIVNGEDQCLRVQIPELDEVIKSQEPFHTEISPVLQALRRCNNFFIQGKQN